LSSLPDPVQETRRCVCDDLEWWHEVYLLEVGRLREHLGLAVSLLDAICPESNDQRIKPTDSHWRASALAGEALVELRLTKRIEEKRRYKEDTSYFDVKLNRVVGWLTALLETGGLPPRERVGAGKILANLPDPRPGVGLDAQTGLPNLVWCEAPSGVFTMGTLEEEIPTLVKKLRGEAEWYKYETPQHEISLPTFYISRYPVTNAQYEAFVKAGGYQEGRHWTEAKVVGIWEKGKVLRRVFTLEEGKPKDEKEFSDKPFDFGQPFNLPNHPVVGVCWYEALAFCRWLSEKFQVAGYRFQVWKEGRLDFVNMDKGTWQVRLPTEAEWEKAARGTHGRIYPWGNEPDPNKANYDKTGIGASSAVGCFPLGESPYGALDMSGNVWEWCQTKWRENYRQPADESLEETDPRVVRGGSWIASPRYMRCAIRYGLVPNWYYDLGFRVVFSPGSP